MRTILIEKSTERSYRSLPEEIQDRIRETIHSIAECEEPSKHSKVKILEGPRETVYRARIGEYRVVFTIELGQLKIWRVGKRNGIYDGINKTYEQVTA